MANICQLTPHSLMFIKRLKQTRATCLLLQILHSLFNVHVYIYFFLVGETFLCMYKLKSTMFIAHIYMGKVYHLENVSEFVYI